VDNNIDLKWLLTVRQLFRITINVTTSVTRWIEVQSKIADDFRAVKNISIGRDELAAYQKIKNRNVMKVGHREFEGAITRS
jgi:hypothetical protein